MKTATQSDIASVLAVIDAYENALTVHIYDEDSGQVVPIVERQLVAEARCALTRMSANVPRGKLRPKKKLSRLNRST